MSLGTVRIEREGCFARVTLARPDVRNAFDAEMIRTLHDAFTELAAADDVRAIVLAGAGKTFSGGADVHWMRASLELSHAENAADARAMAAMFAAIDHCAKPVIARVHGAALGGGAGLCAVADIVVAADDTVFGFTETKLGILPAVISPFVLAKIGSTHARRFFLSGERFDAVRAQAIGLVHEVRPTAELDACVDNLLAEFRTTAPTAVAAAKALIPRVRAATAAEATTLTADAIATQRTSAQGQEGLRAFLERRAATWHAP